MRMTGLYFVGGTKIEALPSAIYHQIDIKLILKRLARVRNRASPKTEVSLIFESIRYVGRSTAASRTSSN
jgi:hypothetical protein